MQTEYSYRMLKVLSAEHFTYKFKISAKLWHLLHQSNNGDDTVVKIVTDYVQGIVEVIKWLKIPTNYPQSKENSISYLKTLSSLCKIYLVK